MIRNATVVLLATLFTFACATTDNDKTARGAGVGAAAGAIAGAIIGNQSGNPRTGAAVGAAVGAGVGAAVGHRMDQQERELQQIPGVDVSRPAENQIDVRLTNDILFDVDSSALRSESRSALGDLASNVRRYSDETVDVEGHTDSTGGPDHNQTLSQRRAGSVREYLVAQGIAPGAITATGYGESRPKDSNDTPEGRQRNRRVEIHIRAPQQ